jgi:putative hemolysin
MESHPFLFILFSLLLSAFFSGMEIAFVSANKLKIELDKKAGFLSARIISNFNENPSMFITAMLIGNNAALVVYGISFAFLFEPMLIGLFGESEILILLSQTILSTAVILVTAEFLPKTLFRMNPNGVLSLFAIPTFIIYFLFYPIVWVVNWIATSLLKGLFKIEIKPSIMSFGRIDLDDYVKRGAESVERMEELENEVQIFHNALDFSKTKARECMVPRTDVIAIEEGDSVEKLKNLFVETGLSKILVFREDMDTIIGYVHSNELLKRPTTIKQILIPVPVVPESMMANDVLALLNKQKKSIALVLDEFGGTSGILTVEDILEEIVGEIEDEHDKEEYIEEKLEDGSFLLSARLEIDYLNDEYDLNLPVSEDYNTLAGLIYHHEESIPEAGTRIDIQGFPFEVIEASDSKIETVKLLEERVES